MFHEIVWFDYKQPYEISSSFSVIIYPLAGIHTVRQLRKRARIRKARRMSDGLRSDDNRDDDGNYYTHKNLSPYSNGNMNGVRE